MKKTKIAVLIGMILLTICSCQKESSQNESSEIANPSIPGTVYNGTDDADVFKMLIFSCFKNCNSKYFESMFASPLTPNQIPEGGSISQFVFKPSGRVVSISSADPTKLAKTLSYPQAEKGKELIHLEVKISESSKLDLGCSVVAAKVKGKYYILRAVNKPTKENN